MRYFIYKGRGLCMQFLAPDGGESSGGGSASGDSSSAGTVDIESLFKDIPLDELDSKTQQAITKARDSVKSSLATLQKQSIDSPENRQKLEQTNETLRRLQSDRDKLVDQLRKLTGGDMLHGAPTEDEYVKAAEDTLRKSKYSEEEIKKQAPIYAELLKGQLKVFQKELNRDINPVVGSVLQQEARSAFEEAQEKDNTGILDVPEVAEVVWQQVLTRVKAGQPSNAPLVLNLAKIAWHDYTADKRQKGEEVPNLRSTTPTPVNQNGSFSFPGAGRVAGAVQATARISDNANQPKHQLNADTEAAVEATAWENFRSTGIAPAQFKEKFEKKVKGRR